MRSSRGMFWILLSAALALGAAPAATTQTALQREAAEYFQATVGRYMRGEWEGLGEDLGRNTRLTNALPRDQQSEITYIRAAVNDGRPAWWNAVKQGQMTNIQTRLWQATANATFDPQAPQMLQVTNTQGRRMVQIRWNHADMDSTAEAEHGFTRGDLVYRNVWSTVESARIYAPLTYQTLSQQTEAQKLRLLRYSEFRGNLTAAFYGPPRTRQWMAFLAMDAFVGSQVKEEEGVRLKPLGAMLLAEFVTNRAKYPSLPIPRKVEEGDAEKTLAAALVEEVKKVKFSYAEDKALREAIREFAVKNGAAILNTGKITFANEQVMLLNPAEDGDAGKAREQWLKERLRG